MTTEERLAQLEQDITAAQRNIKYHHIIFGLLILGWVVFLHFKPDPSHLNVDSLKSQHVFLDDPGDPDRHGGIFNTSLGSTRLHMQDACNHSGINVVAAQDGPTLNLWNKHTGAQIWLEILDNGPRLLLQDGEGNQYILTPHGPEQGKTSHIQTAEPRTPPNPPQTSSRTVTIEHDLLSGQDDDKCCP